MDFINLRDLKRLIDERKQTLMGLSRASYIDKSFAEDECRLRVAGMAELDFLLENVNSYLKRENK